MTKLGQGVRSYDTLPAYLWLYLKVGLVGAGGFQVLLHSRISSQLIADRPFKHKQTNLINGEKSAFYISGNPPKINYKIKMSR